MSTAVVVPLSEMQVMAKSVAESNLFGIKTPQQAMALMLVAQAEGTHPALAARDYHVIQGRPALKADALLARFQAAGGVVEWVEYTDEKVGGKFSHPQNCPRPVLIEWTIKQASKIGLASKDNWKNYPRQMLRARCISEGVRTAYPGIAVGIYTVEEAQDMKVGQPAPRDMGRAETVPLTEDEIQSEIKRVEATTSRDEAMAVWAEAAPKCRAANDAEAHARIKDAVTKKVAEFAGAV